MPMEELLWADRGTGLSRWRNYFWPIEELVCANVGTTLGRFIGKTNKDLTLIMGNFHSEWFGIISYFNFSTFVQIICLQKN